MLVNDYYLLSAGFLLLLVGGELLVRGGVVTARRLGVSPLLVGITIVGFGTSTPELVTSLQAAFLHSPGIAFGNVVGSNIVNVLLILGLAAAISPITIPRLGLGRDSLALLGSCAMLAFIAREGELTTQLSLICLGLLVLYMVICYFTERQAPLKTDLVQAKSLPLIAGLALLVLGIGGAIEGAHLLVIGAIGFARKAGLSESVIGVTIVALGTSLPELVASLAAVARRQGGIAFGNIVGSNIYNVFAIPAITGLVKPIVFPADIAHFDLWVMIAATVALVLFSLDKARLSRGAGIALVAGYLAYCAVVYLRATGAF